MADTTARINSGTREIAAGANDLSKRTEQQAASLDEITANVNSSTKRTEEARGVAIQANQSAAKSAEVVSHGGGHEKDQGELARRSPTLSA